ncbi:MAG: hypothetical protein V2A76_07960 [Planctomycetota bacterium]
MGLFWISATMAVGASVLYHTFQKSIPAGAHPFVSVVVTFSTALLASLAILPFLRMEGGLAAEVRKLNWASVGLGLVIVITEVGFLLFYRSGWKISIGPIFSTVATALVLVPVGLAFYRERLTGANFAGAVLALVGMFLMTRK